MVPGLYRRHGNMVYRLAVPSLLMILDPRWWNLSSLLSWRSYGRFSFIQPPGHRVGFFSLFFSDFLKRGLSAPNARIVYWVRVLCLYFGESESE